jgi:hypothetical protein
LHEGSGGGGAVVFVATSCAVHVVAFAFDALSSVVARTHRLSTAFAFGAGAGFLELLVFAFLRDAVVFAPAAPPARRHRRTGGVAIVVAPNVSFLRMKRRMVSSGARERA